jgi:hypothetical protein
MLNIAEHTLTKDLHPLLNTKWVAMPILLFLIITFQSCGLDIEDSTPPTPPQWVEKSLAEEWPERGIDADGYEGIKVEWEGNPDEDIIAYMVYRATWHDLLDSLGEYELLAHLETESLTSLEFLDLSTRIKTRYYYKLKAIDSSDNTSTFSDSLTYMLLYSVLKSRMSPNARTAVLQANRSLYWGSSYHSTLQNYIVTLTSQEDELITRVVLQPIDYVGGDEVWRIPDEIELVDGMIYKWRVDKGAHYVSGRESSGSESVWAYFLYEQ